MGRPSRTNASNGSFYSQGCNGGLPYLVGKVSNFSIASERYFPYESGLSTFPSQSDGGISMRPPYAKKCSDPAEKYGATNVRHVGGYFGNCSEVAMMTELAIAVGIMAGGSFYDVKSGIYRVQQHKTQNQRYCACRAPFLSPSLPPSPLCLTGHGLLCRRSPAPGPATLQETAAERKARRDGWGKIVDGFEPTGHAVLIVGYGVGENGTKYWRVKNSWRRHFGSSGYFRVRRGRDEIAIESTAVSVDIVLPWPAAVARRAGEL